jgi:uncharacterized protein Veg
MKNYCPKENDESKRKFQDSWATKLPWIEMNIGSDRLLHVVKCDIFLVINGCEKILASKLDTLTKHNGRHKTNKVLKTLAAKKSSWFITKHYKHTKNKKSYASHNKYAIHELITIDIKGEGGRK